MEAGRVHRRAEVAGLVLCESSRDFGAWLPQRSPGRIGSATMCCSPMPTGRLTLPHRTSRLVCSMRSETRASASTLPHRALTCQDSTRSAVHQSLIGADRFCRLRSDPPPPHSNVHHTGHDRQCPQRSDACKTGHGDLQSPFSNVPKSIIRDDNSPESQHRRSRLSRNRVDSVTHFPVGDTFANPRIAVGGNLDEISTLRPDSFPMHDSSSGRPREASPSRSRIGFRLWE